MSLEQRHSYTNKLANITNAYQLEQIFKEPTRVTENPKSLIDLIFSNKPELIIKSGVEHVGISDHSLIYIHRKISISGAPPKIVKTRQYKYDSNQLFKSDLREILQTMFINQRTQMNFGMIGELDFVADKHGPPITR